MLIISFETDELRQQCCEYANAEAALGALDARALFTALADAEATENAAEWIEFSGDELAIDDDGSLLLSFGAESFARLIPVGVKFEMADDGSVKWQTVRHLKLTHMGNRD